MTLPFAVTMGDPCGVGPEIVAKLFARAPAPPGAIVVGDIGVLERTIRALGLKLAVHRIARPGEWSAKPGTVDAIQAGENLPANLPVGRVDARAGRAAFAYVRRAAELALAKQVRGIVTAPLNKEAMHAAGIEYPGHTEILAALSGVPDVRMMLAGDVLRVVLDTIHVPLRAVPDLLSVDHELVTIRLAHGCLRGLGLAQPRVAVAGLNPHAGENQAFGHEDAAIIRPAVERARAEGIDASGPWPGDTVFMRARRGEFDVVVAQYHDQGLIPVKYLGLDRGVNVTLGLPFIRTSVDHGTAFDIAGKGVASHASLAAALAEAEKLTAAV
ncbi:MAG: 4-hydroxythreonine-4-phosphate dehydrogenase PdxA [Rhodospirillales bacterium]